MVTEVSDFESEVLAESHNMPVLVDFWAPWCGPCRQLGPILEKLAGENDGNWKLAKLNTDENPEVSSRYRVSSIPAVKLFVDGEVVDEFLGALPEAQVRRWLDNAVPNATKLRLEAARRLVEEGDERGAEAALREVLADEPANDAALVWLARLSVFHDPAAAAASLAGLRSLDADQARVRDAVLLVADLVSRDKASLPEGPGRESYAAALAAIAQNDLDAAMAAVIDVLRKDRKYDNDGARRAGLAIFALLGEKHPTTRKHRRAFDLSVF